LMALSLKQGEQMAVLAQRMNDLEHRLDIHRQQIDQLDTPVVAERLTKLEDFVRQHHEAEVKAEEESTARWNGIKNTMSAIFVALVGILFNELWKRYKDRKRRLTQKTNLDGQLQEIREKLDLLKS